MTFHRQPKDPKSCIIDDINDWVTSMTGSTKGLAHTTRITKQDLELIYDAMQEASKKMEKNNAAPKK